MFTDLDSREYSPILAISRAEMVALEELPEKTKDKLLPIFPMKGWAAAADIGKMLERIELSFGKRPWIADLDLVSLDRSLSNPEKKRMVHDELNSLRDPANGYKNWCDFILGTENLIPCLRLEDEKQLERQLLNLNDINRPLAVRFIEGKTLPGLTSILQRIRSFGIENLYIILDYEQKRQNDLVQEATYLSHIAQAFGAFPKGKIIFSATSFPNSFSHIETGNDEQEIYERTLFNRLKSRNLGNLIFSDRGSVNLNNGGGGGEPIPPRIDYPLKGKWVFYRAEFEENSDKDQLYQSVASSLIKNKSAWNAELYIWGTEMIRRTASGNSTGKRLSINSPASATASRINIHLYLQAHYNASTEELIDTDDDWEDGL